MAADTDPPPAAFFYLVPLGMAVNFTVGIDSSTIVLRALELSRDSPGAVLFMPQVLRLVGPSGLTGVLLAVRGVAGGIVGTLAGRLSDSRGLKSCCFASVVFQIAANALVVFTPTYLIGLLISGLAGGVSMPLFMALFTSQFDGEMLTQKMTTYMYMAQNSAFVLATLFAGIQPCWAGYVEVIAFLLVTLLIAVSASATIRDSAGAKEGAQERPGARAHDIRVIAFAAMCPFTLLFWASFLMYLGGAFMVFLKEELQPLGNFQVPAQWFLTLNGFADLCMGVPLTMLYERAGVASFHLKFRFCFIALVVASGLLSLAARLAPHGGGVSPLTAAVAMMLVSFGEMNYNPVMLAAISTDFPPERVGMFTGIHYFLGSVGTALVGAGVPVYRAMGAGSFFLVYALAAVAGLVGLQAMVPCVDHCLGGPRKDELDPLRPKRPTDLGAVGAC
mmetsp:Transcript_105776/g.329730  ORF Transcript_105776/g.329730 Transcript_105776/m.329730 type:complete len:447 (-) Transcript_105776:18-1358(-)|eukprot:CAMPEP_0204599588 /NCGR_PEP_ID=MMETSP0661-20131031/54919_1 /ASSEMBLY_ACC=CAM_ASM_000606 /TAXON_ID=109239 /ORGANISM="Alexandrium margalefi, Strain AMGDE01CS-322" /LENGTH=446 /DNA_ID=CAMNT_0051610333 /DNA_START=37 /DNA_END=1377 /DNA_ORIENTATION=+